MINVYLELGFGLILCLCSLVLFEPWFILQLCRCLLYKCYIYLWMFMFAWDLGCYFKCLYLYICYNNKLSIYYLFMYIFLKPCFNCLKLCHHSYYKFASLYIFVPDVIRSLYLCVWFLLYLILILLIQKPKKLFLYVEVPEHCWPRCLGSKI